jgi:hypothetical protein
VNKQSLKTAVITANNAAYQSLGTAIPANMRRYIYRIKTVNLIAGLNELTLARGPAASEVAVDYLPAATQNEVYIDPDELKEDSAPIYIFEAGDANIRVITDNGNMRVFVIYADEP